MPQAPRQKVLLVGAHGETGRDILAGLVEDGGYEISCLVQPSSAAKPAVKALADRGFMIVTANLADDVDSLAETLKGFDILISAINARFILDQVKLVDAAAKAGIKRFVPCDFAVVVPPGGVMSLRDEKEVVHQRIWYHHLPYTFLDIGYWHQISWFRVPSGRLDYALLQPAQVYGHNPSFTSTLFSDKRDIGRFLARILRDPRTLNRSVIAWSDQLTQAQIISLIEAKTGEKVEYSTVSAADLEATISRAEDALARDPGNAGAWVEKSSAEYNRAKWVRGDGTLENAKYLGYLDARELYPEFQPMTFEAFVDELVGGGAKRPYAETDLRAYGKAE